MPDEGGSEWLRHLLPGAWGQATRQLRHYSSDAEDAVQEGLLAAWRADERWDPERGSQRHWRIRVCRGAVHLASAGIYNRRDVAAGLIDDDEDLIERPDPDPTGEAGDASWLSARVRAAVRELPPAERAAVVLIDLLDMSGPVAAEVLGATANAVHQARWRGHKRLRETLADLAA